MSEILWISNLAGTQTVALRDVDGLTIEDRLGEVSSIRFSLRADDPKISHLVPDGLVRCGERRFRIFEIEQTRGAGGAIWEVYGEAIWTDLGRKVRFANFPLLGLTPQAGLVKILQGSGWTAGVDPGSATLYSTEGYDETVLSHLRRWAALCGFEVAFDETAKTVSLVSSVGEDRGVGFRYGSNVKSIRRRYEPPRATVLFPVGANSLTIETVNPSGDQYVEDFSWYVAQGLTTSQARTLHTKQEVYVDEGILLPANLLDRGVERLATLAQPVISYECSVVDLSDAVGTVIPFEVGDRIKVRDETFDVDVETRIVRRVYRPNAPGGDDVELAYLRPTYEDTPDSRSPSYDTVSVLVDRSEAVVVSSAVDYAEIAVNVTGTTTVVVGSTFVGTATGAGEIRFSFLVDGVVEGGQMVETFADGELVEFSAPSYVADLDSGAHLLAFRAQVISGAGSISVAEGEARGWALATGAFGLGVNTSPNARIVEEIVDYVLDDASDAFLVELQAALDVVAGETVSDYVLDPVTDLYVLPFTIGDPVFGAIEGPGRIPS